MKMIAVIPARSGSKGVPNKNIRPLAGEPLIAYSIVTAKKCGLIQRVIVSTDSQEYAHISKQYGAEVPFLRPSEIAGDVSTDYEFVKHLLDWLEDNEQYTPDIIVHLRPTTPLRDPRIIEHAIQMFVNNSQATALRSAHEMPETAYKQFELDAETAYFKTIREGVFDLDQANMSRQAFPKTYAPNGYVDVLRTSFIRTHNLLHGNRVIGYVTPLSIEVDAEEDFEYLEWLMSKNKNIMHTLFPEHQRDYVKP